MTKTANHLSSLALAAAFLFGGSSLAIISAEEATLQGTAAQFTEKQAREHLARLGYRNITPMVRDENGTWRGAAQKDGTTRIVAVGINVAR